MDLLESNCNSGRQGRQKPGQDPVSTAGGAESGLVRLMAPGPECMRSPESATEGLESVLTDGHGLGWGGDAEIGLYLIGMETATRSPR